MMNNKDIVTKKKEKFPFILRCLILMVFIHVMFVIYVLGQRVYIGLLQTNSFDDTVIDIEVVDRVSGDNIVATLASMNKASVDTGIALKIGDLVKVEEKVNSKGDVVERMIIDNLNECN